MTDKIPDILIERAVELWRRETLGGDWDNGDALSNALVRATAPSINGEDFPAKVNEWARLLIERLKFVRDHDGEQMPEAEWIVYHASYTQKDYRFDHRLTVDYHPSGDMAKVAKEVGLSDFSFPCKSSVEISYTNDHVTASFGYRAGHINHYPMPDGGWLLTDLRGLADMPKVIAAVADGTLSGFEIELPASVGARPEGGDALAAPFTSDAVGAAETPENTPSKSSHPASATPPATTSVGGDNHSEGTGNARS